MKHHRLARTRLQPPRLLLVLLCALAPAAIAAAASAPLSVYGQLPFMEHVALSPEGTRFAFATTTANEETAVIVSAVSDLHQLAAVSAGAQKVRNINWADNHGAGIADSRARRHGSAL